VIPANYSSIQPPWADPATFFNHLPIVMKQVPPMLWWLVNGQPAGNSWTSPANNGAFGTDWYLTSAPIITANWEAFGSQSSNRWVIPIGCGFGKIVKTGGHPST
jgi:hypothetical protein